MFDSELRKAEIAFKMVCAETEPDFVLALKEFGPDLIVSDFSLPRFDGMSALRLAQSIRPDVPFIFVSGTIGEEAAIRALTHGASDYVLKDNLTRLPSAIRRVLQNAADRIAKRQAEQALVEADRRYHRLVEVLPDAICIVRDRRLDYINGAGLRLYGAIAPEQMIGRLFVDFVHEDSQGAATLRMRRIQETGAMQPLMEQRHVRLDGTTVYVEIAATSIEHQGKPANLTVIRDITARKQAENKQAQLTVELQDYVSRLDRLNRVRTILGSINGAILRIRDSQALLDEVCRIAVEEGKLLIAWIGMVDETGSRLEFKAHAGKGRECFENVIVPLSTAEDQDAGPARTAVIQDQVVVWHSAQHDDVPRGAWRERAQTLGCQSLIALPLRVEGRPVGAFTLCAAENGFFSDEEKKLLMELAANAGLGLGYIEKADRLQELVYYDQLTGLANQTLVEDRLQQAISRATYSTRIVATLVVNILRLRQINDLLGRGAGDAVVRAVGEGISTAVRTGDTVGRLGAHDFVVVLVDIASAGDLPEIVRKIRAAVPQSVPIDGDDVTVRARIGVAVFPRDGQSAGELIRNASRAVSGASSSEGPEIVFYSSAADEVAQHSYVIERELRRAIDQKELFLEYQPIMTLPQRQIERVEALLRWKNERLGLVRPDRFISIAEESGQINKIGAWVIEEASRQGCLWSDALKRPIRVAVNVSPRQLRTPGFGDLVVGIVRRISGNREHFRFEVEITESAVMDNIDHAVAVLQILKAAGITVSIDDFGTGHSSLSRLRALPIDCLKIDRSFVHDLETDPDAEAVAKSIVALAHALGMRVVAEGVETDGQLRLLTELGCDMAQGFLLGRPMSADRLSSLL